MSPKYCLFDPFIASEQRQTSKRPVLACNEPDGTNDLGQLSRELRHKSKELHSAHLAQSKEFYR